MRWTVLGVALGLAVLGGLAIALTPPDVARDAAPLAGLLMIALGAYVLGRPLARVAARLVLGPWVRAAGIASIVGTAVVIVVLGPASAWPVAMVVLAMLGVSLLAIGSTCRLAMEASPLGGLVDAPTRRESSEDAGRSRRSRAA